MGEATQIGDGRDWAAEVDELLDDIEAADDLPATGWTRLYDTLTHLDNRAGAAAGLAQAVYLRYVQAFPGRLFTEHATQPHLADTGSAQDPRPAVACPCGGRAPSSPGNDYGTRYRLGVCRRCGAPVARLEHETTAGSED